MYPLSHSLEGALSVTHFTIFCEIVEEEERVTPALLTPLKVLRFRVCWQATKPCMGSLTGTY